jgi:hypothetical protein
MSEEKCRNSFSKIPTITFCDNKKKMSLTKICEDEKVILVMDYLYNNMRNSDNLIMFTFSHLIDSCGYKVQHGRRGSNDNFVKIIKKLVEINAIDIIRIQDGYNLDNVRMNDFIECSIKLKYNSDFVMLYHNEKNKILNCNFAKVSSSKLLIYYCYLKSKIHIRKDNEDIAKTGGRANVCFPSYETIRRDIGLSPNTTKEYNDALCKLNLIRIGNAGLWHFREDSTKKKIESPNTYVLYDGEDGQWKNELEEGIRQYKKLFGDERIFVGTREYKNSNRKINGKIGALTRLKNDGRATSEQLTELASLKAMLEEQKEERKRSKEDSSEMSNGK